MLQEFLAWCKENPNSRPSPFSLNGKERRLAAWYAQNIKLAEDAANAQANV